MSLDLAAALTVADQLARSAGALLLEALEKPRQIDYKGAINLVTESDRQSEALIVHGLIEAFPDHHIVGEEGGGMGAPIKTAPYRWYVDPLDGTTNFAHGIPYFSVSIAVADTDDKPLVGVVYHPSLDECFQAVRGQGATLNGKPIRPSQIAVMEQSVFATGFPYDRWTNPENNTQNWFNFLMRSQAVSRMGSAALNLCYVACGRFEGYWEKTLNSWDIQAGALCVLEAGGRFTNSRGEQDHALFLGRDVIASNGLLHDQMLAILTQGESTPRAG
ncbi:MAG: inositol monophosphatase [Anaerolineae bacterium]|nr:inositol monophosphatase [Anaerolineae bacterium]